MRRNRHPMNDVFKQIAVWTVAGVISISARAGSFAPAPTALDYNNPHKGFMLWGTDYADGAPVNHYGATIYHVYMPWREIETADQVFDWGRFETNHLIPVLNDHPEATFVLRPVADYPDGAGSGITLFYTGGELTRDFPAFITNAPLSIPFFPYTSCDGDGPGVTPDWNHPAMQTQLVQFVQALAQRYDGDPRITAIQVGMLGLWGEWHQSGCDNRQPSNAVKIAVRQAYATHLTNTPVQTRYPRYPDATGVDFGFHEDYFPSFTAPCVYGFPFCDASGDWSLHYCFQQVTPSAATNWRSNPISGESPLNTQKRTWSNDVADVMTVLRDYHFSFLGPAGGHQWNGNQANLNPMKRLLGYNYHIGRVDWPDTVAAGQSFVVTLVLTNTGAAPAYHRFPAELALCTADGTPVWRAPFALDVRTIMPAAPFSATEMFTATNLAPGTYSLRIGIIDPRIGEPGVRIQSVGEDVHHRIIIGDIEVVDGWTLDSDADGLPDGWEFVHFGNTTNTPASGDADLDGVSNLGHYISGTEPTNSASFFRVDLFEQSEFAVLRFQSVTNRRYRVKRASALPETGGWTDVGADFDGTGEAVEIAIPAVDTHAVFRAEVGLP